jgi:molecular chaperone GrpE
VSFDPEAHPAQGPVIRDKRRIDPETGQMRERPETAAPASPAAPQVSSAELELAERTSDLQRLQAEYLNYKRRVDRERENTRVTAVASTLGALLPVLDDIARAREHEELTGGFKAVAESLERTVAQLGMTSFGEPGDPFDPRIHEALMHSYSEDVDGPVCQAILQVGYQIGDRIVRPARVAVAEPPTPVSVEPKVGSAAVADDDLLLDLEDEASGSTPYDNDSNAVDSNKTDSESRDSKSSDGPAGESA